jgi:hypothetical protein
MVKNLDTGEMVALKDADVKLPKCVDPLVLHMMERTNEYPRFVLSFGFILAGLFVIFLAVLNHVRYHILQIL